MHKDIIKISDKLIWVKDISGEWHLLNMDNISSIDPIDDLPKQT